MERTSIGPYQITERLGVGGMGEVFKAYDDRLERWVAIKKILPDKEDDKDNRERLRREARATAKLNHPSIVQVYDIFQDGDHDCIVMEYIEGSTLDRVVANGRLSLPDLLRAGSEIASGLAEAHGKKILHRDLKTENIIITPSGQAKILDFGLAKALRGSVDPSLTAHDQMVGTSRALSPEYASGDEIDHRSDLFQLGILLYEAATGHSPFRAHNTLATLKRVILHHQTPVREVNPEIPAELSDLVDLLLEKEPEDRPADARWVEGELTKISDMVSSGEHDRASSPYLSGGFSILPSSGTSISRRRQRWWLLGLLALLGAVAGGFYLVGQRSAGGGMAVAADKSVSVLLLDFKSQLTDDDMLGPSLQTALKVGLQQARFINLVPRQTIDDALVRMERQPGSRVDRTLGIDVAKREGIPRMVEGQILKIGSTFKLIMTLIAAADESELSWNATARSEDDLIPELDKLVKQVRQGLGEVLTDSDQSPRPLEKVTTRNLRALEAYSQGIARFDVQDNEGAIPFFQRAIELDPEFGMAHAKLGTAYRNLNRDQEIVDLQLAEALRHTDRLTEVEQIYVRGWRAMSHGSPDEIIEIWRKMSKVYPAEPDGHYNLGRSLSAYRNDFERAAAAFEKFSETSDRSEKVFALSEIGFYNLALERKEEALAYFADAQALGLEAGIHRHNPWEAVGDYEESIAHFEEALLTLQNPEDQSATKVRLSVSYAAEGRLEEGIQLASAAKSQSMAHWEQVVSGLVLARYHAWLGEDERANAELDELVGAAIKGLERVRGRELRNEEKGVITQGAIVGKLAARGGRLEESKRIFSLIEGLGVVDTSGIWAAYGLMLEGEILLREQEPEAALARFGESLSKLESLQIQESLAHAHASIGSLDRALVKYEWLISRRGRSYAECTEVCFDWGLNIVSWPMYHYEAALISERLGQTDRAAELYTGFLAEWSVEGTEGDVANAFVRAARERLLGLGPSL